MLGLGRPDLARRQAKHHVGSFHFQNYKDGKKAFLDLPFKLISFNNHSNNANYPLISHFKTNPIASKWIQTMLLEPSFSHQNPASLTQFVISPSSTSATYSLNNIQVVEKLIAQFKVVKGNEPGCLMFQISKSNPWQGDGPEQVVVTLV